MSLPCYIPHMTTLRLGILGTGNIAHQFAGGVFAKVNGATRCTLAAVASRSGDKARAFAERYGIEHHTESYQGLIDLPDEVCDAVYIALPNDQHAHWAIKAMQAGKHVLCEKPIAMDADEAARMFEVSRATGMTLIEAFMYRCHPQTCAVVEAVRSGAIGELTLIRSSFCFNVRNPEGNTRFNRAQGGGALMDIGCYCIDLAMLLTGRAPTAARAVGRLHPSGVDVSCSGLLTFAGSDSGGTSSGGGIESTFTCAMDTQASNAAQLCGTEGYIDIPIPWKPPDVGARWAVRGMAALKQDEANKQVGGEDAGGPYAHEHTVDAGQSLYALEADAFARVVQDGRAPFVTERETIDRMRVIDELRRQVGVSWA